MNVKYIFNIETLVDRFKNSTDNIKQGFKI